MANGAMKVLLAIDGSEPAGLALDLVADIAWPAGTEFLVAEVVETGAGLFGGLWPALAMGERTAHQQARRSSRRRS